MVKQHGQLLQLGLVACDMVVISAAWGFAYLVRFTLFPFSQFPAPRTTALNLFIALVVSGLVHATSGLYRPRRDKSFLLEIGQIIKASLLTWVILVVAIYYTQNSPFTRGMLGMFLLSTMGGLILARGLFRSFLRYIRRRGWNQRHALIVGTGRLGQSTLLKLQSNSWTGIHVMGFVEAPQSPATQAPRSEVRGLPVIGLADNLLSIVETTHVDCVFVALSSPQGEQLRQVIAQLEQCSADVRIIPDLFLSRLPMNVSISELDGLPVLSLRESPLAGWPALYKRCFDIFGALFGLAILGIPMLMIALLIKFTTFGGGPKRGPVIYRQRRVSFGGRPFDIFKFRTMHADAETDLGPAFAVRDDPRCTRLGRHLRSFSVDELPQLFNVLKGDMSLVGPRPERPEMLEKIRQEVPTFPQRLKVRAGLTGWAQINGFRGRTSFRKRLQYDLYYLNHWSPLLDFRIVFATLFRGFRDPNAY